MVLASTIATSAFYSSRPTIRLDNQDQPELSLGLLTLFVRETIEGLYTCEVSFGNWGSTPDGSIGTLYDDRSVFDFGKRIQIETGDGDAQGIVFDGRIMALEAHYPQTRPPEIVILAEDRFQDLRMTRRTRTFENVSDSDVIQTIASEHGLRANIDLNGPTYPVLAQLNQSDLAFIRSRARAVDVELWVEDTKLYARSRQARSSTPIQLVHGQSLIEFSAMADIARQRTSIKVGGWDVQAKETLEYEATKSVISSELSGGTSGAAILEDAIGERVEFIVHQAPISQREAQSLAEAHFRRMARQFVTGQGTTDGDARIRVGAVVEIAGLGGIFNGKYYVVEAQHLFDNTNGYRTSFMVERAGV